MGQDLRYVCECNSNECELTLPNEIYDRARKTILEKFNDSQNLFIISIKCRGEPFDNFGKVLFRDDEFVLQGEL